MTVDSSASDKPSLAGFLGVVFADVGVATLVGLVGVVAFVGVLFGLLIGEADLPGLASAALTAGGGLAGEAAGALERTGERTAGARAGEDGELETAALAALAAARFSAMVSLSDFFAGGRPPVVVGFMVALAAASVLFFLSSSFICSMAKTSICSRLMASCSSATLVVAS